MAGGSAALTALLLLRVTLVLLHALGTDRHMWTPSSRTWTGEDVLALDMPGFGAAPPLPTNGGITPHALAAAIHADLQRRGIERPDVAGNSLGGWVALEPRARRLGAVGHRDRAGLGLWAQPLAPKRATARAAARALSPALPVLLRSERGRQAALGGTIARPERVPYDAALALVQAYADAPGFDAVNAGMRANRFTGLDEIERAAHLAWPEFDRLVGRPEHVPETAREFFLDGCGHMPTYDDPEAVARVLRAGAALS